MGHTIINKNRRRAYIGYKLCAYYEEQRKGDIYYETFITLNQAV